MVNGNVNLGWFPSGIVAGLDEPIPIRLHIGNKVFGAYHIQTKHKVWLEKQQTEAHCMVWRKLQTQGHIYTTESETKHKFSLRIHPAALMVVELREHQGERYFSVVTLYSHPQQMDGKHLGRYNPKKNADPKVGIEEISERRPQ